ncbi:MAG: arylsulfatase A-like enzyme, partial [Myxococcota bacterium]
RLDALGERAAVFEAAHSVAPWTLPSTRSVLTGRHPEYYESTPTLQGQLRQQGWATAMFAGNVYLSANFGMTRDWGIHRVGMWPGAEEVTDDALAWLAQNDGRDAAVLVHYMDPHLPYKEPGSYRHLFAGDSCCGLREEFHLPDVREAKITAEADRQYVRDRYDNNIRYATDQLGRIIDVLGDDDGPVVFADHGEEFWDHKGFEHGHTLYEELLHVPLVIKAPGINAVRISQPVSLLDIAPTVLDLLDLPSAGLDGKSLVAVMTGDAAAAEALAGRDLAFGRPLYGHERWGVLTADGKKWTTTGGREALYDLVADPDEQNNTVAKDQREAGTEYRERMAAALGRDVPVSYRLENTMFRGGAPPTDLVVTLTVPGGVRSYWVGDEPLDRSHAVITPVDEEVIEVRWPREHRFTREVYIVPNLPVEEVTHELRIRVEDEGVVKDVFVPKSVSPEPGRYRVPMFKVGLPHRMVKFTWGLAPEKTDDTMDLSGRDSETNAMLEAMGYVARDGDDAPAPPAPSPAAPAPVAPE